MVGKVVDCARSRARAGRRRALSVSRRSCRRRAVLALVIATIAGSCPALPAAADARRGLRLGDRGLRVGTAGRDVRQLQRLLRQVGIDVRVDGRYGSATADAVRRFQRATHLEPSGVVGPRTARRLMRAARGGAAQSAGGGLDAQSEPPRTRNLGDRMPLRVGMSGYDVRALQRLLNQAGFATKVDGQFGKGTANAARAFQAAAGRPADGVVDATDIAALRQLAGAGPQRPGEVNAPPPLAPGETAQLGPDGLAAAPASAPEAVKAIIAAGNQIAKHPYRYGGGHGRWEDTAYDCSGSVSYVLHRAGLLEQPMASGGFTGWGEAGVGRWVTIYANRGHMYMVVAGLRFDTSGARQDGSRWHTTMRTSSGYSVRHVPGL